MVYTEDIQIEIVKTCCSVTSQLVEETVLNFSVQKIDTLLEIKHDKKSICLDKTYQKLNDNWLQCPRDEKGGLFKNFGIKKKKKEFWYRLSEFGSWGKALFHL